MYGTKISTSDWTKDADSSVQNGAKALLGYGNRANNSMRCLTIHIVSMSLIIRGKPTWM